MINILFGWLCRPILLWNFWDILIATIEIYLVYRIIIKIFNRINRTKRNEKYKKEFERLKMRREI